MVFSVCIGVINNLGIHHLLVSSVVLQDFLLIQLIGSSLEMYISAEDEDLCISRLILIFHVILGRFKRQKIVI